MSHEGVERAPAPDLLCLRPSAQLLCDVEARVGAATFAAHRLVLAGASAFFRALYAAEGEAGPPSRLTLSEMPPSAFEAVLEFVYTGACEVCRPAELVPLLEAAGRLQIGPLQDAAAVAIAARLHEGNCLGAWQLAAEHGLPTLEAAARSEALRSFGSLVSGGGVAALSLPRLASLLADDGLRVDAEER